MVRIAEISVFGLVRGQASRAGFRRLASSANCIKKNSTMPKRLTHEQRVASLVAQRKKQREWIRNRRSQLNIEVAAQLGSEEAKQAHRQGPIDDVNMTIDKFIEKVRDPDDDCFDSGEDNPVVALALWYANMGYATFAQHLQFQLPKASLNDAEDAALHDFVEAELTNDDVACLAQKFVAHHSYFPVQTPACDEKLEVLSSMQESLKVTIPTNEMLEPKEVCCADIYSVYKVATNLAYYLHPELVEIEANGKPCTMLCALCYKSLYTGKTGKIPDLSIANGVDFGFFRRIPELTEPNLSEQRIIALLRLYEHMVKIRSNTYGTVNYTHSKIQGHSVLFAHDAVTLLMEKLEELLTKDRLKSIISVIFVGPNKKIDHLMKEMIGTNVVLARSYVVIQWLLVLSLVNQHYAAIPKELHFPSKWKLVDCVMKDANDTILANAEKITDDDEIMVENSLGADINTTSRVPHNLLNGAVLQAHDSDLPMRYSLITDRSITAPFDVCRKEQLDAVYRTLIDNDTKPKITGYKCHGMDGGNKTCNAEEDGSDDDDFDPFGIFGTEDETVEQLHSTRESVPINEIEDASDTATCAFPTVFLFGKAYSRSFATLTAKQVRHMMSQFHKVPSRNRSLCCYVFDSRRRAQTMYGVKALACGNSKAFQKMDKLVNDPDFATRLDQAREHPDNKDSRDLLKQLHQCLRIAGKKQPYGSHETMQVVSEIKELSKSLGCPSTFLTITPDSKNNPRAFLFSQAVTSNRAMPAQLPEPA